MRVHSSDKPATIVDVSRGSLDDFAAEGEGASSEPLINIATAEPPSLEAAAPLSRLESRHARRRRRSRLRRVGTRVVGAGVQRFTSGARAFSTRVHRRVVARLVEKAARAPNLFEHQESDGIVVATLLSIVAVGYGSFLTVTWREPIDQRVAVPQVPKAILSAPATAAVVVPLTTAPSMTGFAATVPAAPAAVEAVRVVARRSGALTAKTLTAMWKRRDTRSLEQAFSGLRSQTLAFHRCGMRTREDRATARCESGSATWTIDFQRSAGRWQIASVSTR